LQGGSEEKGSKTSSNDLGPMQLQWRTPDLPAGYFVSSSRFKYSPKTEDESSPPSKNDGDGHFTEKTSSGAPPISSRIERVVRAVATSRPLARQAAIGASRPPMVRASIGASRPPMVRAAVGASRPPPGVSGSGDAGSDQQSKPQEFAPLHRTSKRPASTASLPPKKRHQTLYRIKEEPGEEHMYDTRGTQQEDTHRSEQYDDQEDTHGSEQYEHYGEHLDTHGSEQSEERGDTHGPDQYKEREDDRKTKQQERNTRDPLLHRPLVTPPPPVLPGQNETPPELRRYTHVSFY